MPRLRANELKRHVNPTRVPIEAKESIRWLSSLTQSGARLGDPGRCVYVGDRENDIYEFFCAAREAGAHFLVRTCVDRLAGDGRRTVARVMARVPVAGQHRIEVTAKDGSVSEAVLKLRYKRVHILPPIGKQKRYPALDLAVIHAREARKPRGRDRIDWKLVTDLAVTSPEQAIEKLQWYAQRWKIDIYQACCLSSACLGGGGRGVSGDRRRVCGDRRRSAAPRGGRGANRSDLRNGCCIGVHQGQLPLLAANRATA
ncbi:protein of unknown function (plasmid) [Rhodovastum atsumiense]|nr:protein of unknown function [Rhodovastum atsumiense]